MANIHIMETKKDIKRTTSEALFEKSKTYFPGGVNSPVRAFKSVEGSPLFIKKGMDVSFGTKMTTNSLIFVVLGDR